MVLENERLERMRERAKQIRAGVKDGAPEETFMDTIMVVSSQVHNLQVCARVRNHDIYVDEPVTGGGDDTAPSPVETLLAAIATCTEINWIAYSAAFGITLDLAEVTVEGTIDRRYIISGIESVPPRLKAVKITSHVRTGESREKIERVHAKVAHFCPVAGSLHPDIEKEYILEILLLE